MECIVELRRKRAAKPGDITLSRARDMAGTAVAAMGPAPRYLSDRDLCEALRRKKTGYAPELADRLRDADEKAYRSPAAFRNAIAVLVAFDRTGCLLETNS